MKFPYFSRFMTDTARKTPDKAVSSIAIVSDNEINRLKFMLGQSDIPVEISEQAFISGDKVRVIRGSLAGLEGVVSDMKATKSELFVELNHFGCARLSIETVNLERITE